MIARAGESVNKITVHARMQCHLRDLRPVSQDTALRCGLNTITLSEPMRDASGQLRLAGQAKSMRFP